MSRRALLGTLALLLLLVMALVPWTLSSERLTRRMARQVKDEFGLDLSATGRTTFALLPVPRVKLQDAVLADGTGAVVIRHAEIRGEFRPLSLLALRPRLDELSVSGARIVLRGEASPRVAFARALGRLRARIAAIDRDTTWIGRLAVRNSRLSVETGSGTAPVEIGELNLQLGWPGLDRSLGLQADAVWRGEPVSIALSGLDVAALLAGRTDTVELSGTSALGRFALSGQLAWTDGLGFTGRARVEDPSVSALVRWFGVGRDFGGIKRSLTVDGAASWGAEGVEWPNVRIDLGHDHLDGALAIRTGGARAAVRATLAGDRLTFGPPDLSGPLAALTWLAEAVRAGKPEADFDIRLSASAMQAGKTVWTDVAAAILSTGDQVELSIARAGVAEGTLKGRVTSAREGESRDLRAQFTLERLDLAHLLAQAGARPGLTGTLDGQVSLEMADDDPGDLVHDLRGRATLAIRDGEIAGLTLGVVPKRVDAPSGAAPASGWRGGRTRYRKAQLTLSLAAGKAEIVDGTLDTAETRTTLSGGLSLADRVLAVRTLTRAASAGQDDEGGETGLALDIRGPLDRLEVKAAAP